MNERYIVAEGDAAQWIIGLSRPTIERLLRLDTRRRSDAIALYVFYCYTARWQNTLQPWATVAFAAKGLGWGRNRVSSANKILRELQLIEHVTTRSAHGRAEKWFIRVHYLVSAESNFLQIQQVVKRDTNALGLNTENTKKLKTTPTPSIDFGDPELQSEWESFQQHRKELRKPITPTARTRLIAKLRLFGVSNAIKALRISIDNGWQGVFDPTKRTRGSARKEPPKSKVDQDIEDYIAERKRRKQEGHLC